MNTPFPTATESLAAMHDKLHLPPETHEAALQRLKDMATRYWHTPGWHHFHFAPE